MRREAWTLSLLLAACVGCASQAPPPGPASEVAITVTEEGFVPAIATVPKGAPVTLVFTRQSDQTCVTDVTFGRLGKSYPLPLHQPVRVEIPGGVKDTLSFTCPMDMYRGMLQAR